MEKLIGKYFKQRINSSAEFEDTIYKFGNIKKYPMGFYIEVFYLNKNNKKVLDLADLEDVKHCLYENNTMDLL